MSYFRPEIEAMTGYVPGEQPQAGEFVKLNTNENPYPPSPAVAEAIHEALDAGPSRYPDPMANGFSRCGGRDLHGVEPDWILCGNGSDDILTIVTRAFVGEGQLLRCPTRATCSTRRWPRFRVPEAKRSTSKATGRWPRVFAGGSDGLRLVFLRQPEQSLRHAARARAGPGIGPATAVPAAGRRSLRRLRRHELHAPGASRRRRSWCRGAMSKSYAWPACGSVSWSASPT